MGRPGITPQDVIRAAETLRRRGQPVTARTVREELGNTGSYSTITDVLNDWEAQNPEQASSASADALLPTQLSDDIHKLAAGLFDDLKVRADQQIQGERDQHRQALAQSEKLRADAVDAATEVTEQNDALKAELIQAQADAAAAQTELGKERAARQEAAGRAAEQTKHNADLNTQLARADAQLTAEKKRHAEERDAAQKRHSADLKAQQDRLDAQLKAEQQRNQQHHEDALNQARQDADLRLSDLRDGLMGQLSVANERAADLDKELKAVRGAADAAAANLQHQLDQSTRECAEAQGALAALREQLARQPQDTAPAVVLEAAPEDGPGTDTQAAEVSEEPKRTNPVRRPPPRKTE